MEAAGRNNVMVQALLSRGINVAVTRKHGDRGSHAELLPWGQGGGGGGGGSSEFGGNGGTNGLGGSFSGGGNVPVWGNMGRGLQSSTFRLNVSACCGIGGASRDCLGVVLRVFRRRRGVLGGVQGTFRVRYGSG